MGKLFYSKFAYYDMKLKYPGMYDLIEAPENHDLARIYIQGSGPRSNTSIENCE